MIGGVKGVAIDTKERPGSKLVSAHKPWDSGRRGLSSGVSFCTCNVRAVACSAGDPTPHGCED